MPQPRVRVVIRYRDKYLLETLNNPRWPQNMGKRRFVGGGVEAGESLAEAAARELYEELGAVVSTTSFRLLGQDPRDGHRHEFYMELIQHDIKPGAYKASVGDDDVITLAVGLPDGDDYLGPDLRHWQRALV